MGIVYVEPVVKAGGVEEKVRLLVDSGATYTVPRREIWTKLGLTPKREVELILADGSVVKRKLSEAIIEIPGYGEYSSPVLLGEP